MIKVKRIDHVAFCVRSTDDTVATLGKLFGAGVETRELVGTQKTEATFVPFGDTHLEIIEPKGNEGLERFLDKRGPGLHHVAIEVEGLEAALAFLKGLGVPLVDEVPRPGARGHRVAFLHPKATGGMLVELVEHGDA